MRGPRGNAAGTESICSAGSRLKISLRLRVLALIAALNLAIFGAGLYFLAGQIERERQVLTDQFSEHLGELIASTITPQGELNVAPILRWHGWSKFDDAIIVRAKWSSGPHGESVPQGAYLNPLGRIERRADFDEQAVVRDIASATVTRASLASHGGTVIPILDPEGREVWGGCWFEFALPEDATRLTVRLLPWFVLSTLVLTLLTFWLLRRFVLQPVEQLVIGAQLVARGDLGVRLAEPARSDELSELIRHFNAMTATVQRYNDRLAQEVESATQKARRAETAAMTQRRLAATGELAAGIAHEINNPLGGLLNAVEALSRDHLPEDKRRQYHQLLRNGLERIQSTVGQLLRFTPRTTKPAPLSLTTPVLDAIALVQHRAQKQGVEIAIASSESESRGREAVIEDWQRLPPVMGEQNELAQSVLNLLVNALDALESTPRGRGRVEVRLARAGKDLSLVVQDNGPGVPEADLPRVADLFYTTKEVGRGTGLGLSIVHNVIANHGGRVLLSSEPGRGFRVEILLPPWNGAVGASEERA
jgi:signal transduction histidine kinase